MALRKQPWQETRSLRLFRYRITKHPNPLPGAYQREKTCFRGKPETKDQITHEAVIDFLDQFSSKVAFGVENNLFPLEVGRQEFMAPDSVGFTIY